MDGYFQKISLMRKPGRQMYVFALRSDRELMYQDRGDRGIFHPLKAPTVAKMDR